MSYRGTMGCAVLPYCVSGLLGRVSKVFSACVHLQAQELIITLGNEILPNHPYNIRLSNYPVGIREGAGVRIDDWQLIIDGCGNIDLRTLKQFRPQLQVSRPVAQEQLRQGLVLSREMFNSLAVTDGLAGLLMKNAKPNCFVTVAGPWIEIIRNAICSRNWCKLAAVAQQLAGLGPGLTPSGDDLLCGLLAGLRFHRESCGDGPRQGMLDDLAQAVAVKTTTFCAQMLKGAGEGLVSEDLADWLQALYLGEFSNLTDLTKRLLAFGHSSGSDQFCGLLIALESMTEGSL